MFVGIGATDYSELEVMQGTGAIDAYNGTGGSHSVAAGRLSYFLGVRGPSMAVDTACSSSLASVHLAVNSLRNGESDVALAGGVNLMMSPDSLVTLCKARMLSPDGRCKTFDASANGYVRGEGCGVLVLKRLADALADGDKILALIRGSAVNHNGRSSGLTVPSGPAQQELIRHALANAGPAAGGRRLCRGARHRHRGRRSDRGRRARRGLRGPLAAAADRLGQVQCGTPRMGGRHLRRDQGDSGDAARPDPAEPARQEAQSASRLGRAAGPRRH